jgi:ATP-dependent DNA helicase RecG
MTIEDIQQLIAHDENRRLELKKSTGELKDGMHTACAFLNGNGGWLIFGIAPTSLHIVGQEVNDHTQQEIAQALSGLEPVVDAEVQYVDVPDRTGYQVIVIYFEAFVWGHKPYTYNGCPYYKVESTTRMMPREMFEERLRAHRPKYYAWERQQAEDIEIENLDENRIRGALRLGWEHGRVHATALTEPLPSVLDKLELLTDGHPNNAAAALFSTTTRNYPQFRLRMARFRGTEKLEFIDNQRVAGNFFELLDAGMDFFLKHLSMSGKIVGFRREEHLEVPATALREALTNCLCHRQFEKYNLTPSIAIFDDRIEIANPGVLPPQITPDNIKLPHGSFPYNPVMAEVLFRATFLENWGTGVKRIMDVCRQYNVPDPVWSWDGGFVYVTFKRINYDNKPLFREENVSSTGGVRAKYVPSSEKVRALIGIMSGEYMSLKEIIEKATELGEFRNDYRFRNEYLTPSIKEGAVERKYNISNHPYQQYRLTDLALRWKDNNGR